MCPPSPEEGPGPRDVPLPGISRAPDAAIVQFSPCRSIVQLSAFAFPLLSQDLDVIFCCGNLLEPGLH